MADYIDPSIGGSSTTGGGFLGLLANPAFQNLLAGIGAGLDPKGVGGAIGNATIGYNKSRQAQAALASPEAARAAYLDKLKETLGGFTPKGEAGVTSLGVAPDGSVNIKLDPPIPTREGITPPTTVTQAPTINRSTQLSDIVPFY